MLLRSKLQQTTDTHNHMEKRQTHMLSTEARLKRPHVLRFHLQNHGRGKTPLAHVERSAGLDTPGQKALVIPTEVRRPITPREKTAGVSLTTIH